MSVVVPPPPVPQNGYQSPGMPAGLSDVQMNWQPDDRTNLTSP
ncbi:MAG: hypothetical protein Q8K86_00160 [Candidatus Nanopelagicaceae bacterium]|nr:hypothetical protein [Candidatus Nanopelagicaceae bacterium]